MLFRSFSQIDLNGSLLDLGKALSLREDETILYNRARVFETLMRWGEATDDYSRALELASGDTRDIARRLNRCREASK